MNVANIDMFITIMLLCCHIFYVHAQHTFLLLDKSSKISSAINFLTTALL